MSTTIDEAGPQPPTTTPDSAPARSRPQHFDIPPLIRRNTVLLALTQAFVGMGNQTTPTLAPIIATRMLGSPDLAGVATLDQPLVAIIDGVFDAYRVTH